MSSEERTEYLCIDHQDGGGTTALIAKLKLMTQMMLMSRA